MKVKIKKLNDKAVIPQYAKEGDAGLDIVATSKEYDKDGNFVYGTGLSFEIPKGYVGLLFPRSSNAKTNLYLTNSVGVLDSGYRGEVMFKYKVVHNAVDYFKHWFFKKVLRKKDYKVDVTTISHNEYNVGDRIGQIVIIKHPYIEFEEANELSETERGEGSYGSTGK